MPWFLRVCEYLDRESKPCEPLKPTDVAHSLRYIHEKVVYGLCSVRGYTVRNPQSHHKLVDNLEHPVSRQAYGQPLNPRSHHKLVDNLCTPGLTTSLWTTFEPLVSPQACGQPLNPRSQHKLVDNL